MLRKFIYVIKKKKKKKTHEQRGKDLPNTNMQDLL